MSQKVTIAIVIAVCGVGILRVQRADARLRKIRVENRRVYVLVPRRPPRGGYPLVVALHWAGGRARYYLKAFRSYYWRRRMIVALPNATRTRWRMSDHEHVLKLVARLRKTYRINPRRIYLIGFSRGGTYAYHFGLAKGSPFRAIAPIAAGWVPFDATRTKGMRICLAHGLLDRAVRPERTVMMRRYLRKRRFRYAIKLVPGVKHEHPPELTPWIWRCLDRNYRRLRYLARRRRWKKRRRLAKRRSYRRRLARKQKRARRRR